MSDFPWYVYVSVFTTIGCFVTICVLAYLYEGRD